MSVREIADGRRVGARTREDIIEALQEYARLYGRVTAACFTPAGAKWGDRPELRERYYTPRPDGSRWPSLNAIKTHFGGSFNAAVLAAGLPVNSPGPARDRRPAHTAAPIRDIREHLVYVRPELAKQERARADRLEARLARALTRADRAETVVREMRARRAVVTAIVPVEKRIVREPARVVTKTVVRKVRDERAVERLRVKLSAEQEARREAERFAVEASRSAAKYAATRGDVQTELDATRSELRALAAERSRLADQLQVAMDRGERLGRELSAAQADVGEAHERALAADYVQAAERRVEDAELRAARAERQMAEQGAAVTGEVRRLTAAEIAELRTNGPAGPGVMAGALTAMAKARKDGRVTAAVLTDVARAALSWRDRL